MVAPRLARTLACAALLVLAVLVPAGGAVADTDPGPQIVLGDPFEGAVYYQGQWVQAAYGCLPGPTGFPAMSCSGDLPPGALLDTSTSGEHTFTVHAVDPFGTTTTTTVHYSVFDVVPPLIDVVAPADHARYEFGSRVVVDYSCSDPGGSGVIACLGPLPPGAPLSTDRLGTFGFDVAAFDAAGHSSTLHITYQVIDDIPPTISVAAPTAAVGDRVPVYTVGQRVLADYSCTDNGGSGIVFCTAPVPSGTPIDTSTVGLHSFTISANDAAHNRVNVARSYEVDYTFDGFTAPLTPWPAFALVDGNDVPLKFSLGGDYGTSVVTGVSSQPIACDTATPLGAQEPARGSTNYNAGPDRYTFHWSTVASWAGTCREVDLTLHDGTVHRANIRFKN